MGTDTQHNKFDDNIIIENFQLKPLETQFGLSWYLL